MLKSLLLILCCVTLLAACAPSDDRPLPTRAVLPTATPVPPTLERWTTTGGSLDSASDIDVWQFTAQKDERITLKVVGHEDSQPIMTLQNLAGSLLAKGDAIEVAIPGEGIYLVQVQSPFAGRYDIGLGDTSRAAFPTATDLPQVVGVPTPTPAYASLGTYMGAIKGGQIISGQLTDKAPQQVYTYQASVGDIITVSMERAAGSIDPLMTLYSPEGDPLAMDDNSDGSDNAKLRNIKLPAEGVYSLQLTGRGQIGSYTLALLAGVQTFAPDPQLIPTPTATEPYIIPTLGFSSGDARLVDHVPVLGSLARGGDFARYSFFASAGETVSVSVLPTATSGLRPMIEMYGPDGTVMASAKSSTSQHNGGALLTRISIAESSAYLLIITGENSSLGDFVLSYGTGTSHTDAFRGTSNTGEQVAGTIQQKGVRDIWRLVLGANDVITVAVSPGNGALDPLVEIYDSSNALMYSDDNNGGGKSALIRSATINRSGIYTIRVSDAAGTNTGAYTLVWRYINLAPTITPVPAGLTILAVNDTIQENQYGFYVFQGQQGQRVRIRIDAQFNSAIDPVGVLLAPDGSTLAQDDDSGGTMNPDFIVLLPQDGTYSVRVNGYLSAGAFTMSVVLISP